MPNEFDIKPRNAMESIMLALLNKPAKPSPYDFYSSHRSASVLSDYERRSEFTHTYSWSIPTEKALATIARYAPIVEIGAGTGLWAAMLQARGVDILAYDAHPPRLGSEENAWHRNVKMFTHIDVGGPEKAEMYPNRSLMLSWPPYDEPMASDCLTYYQGRHVIYIGEGSGGCTGDERFHDTLYDEFEEIEDVRLPQWNGIHDYLSVWRRK